ncbi:glycosyltransferase [Nitrososphaera sp.]|uniref:glycosyltransferase n=1 Tax=Nitrososphaera sp. TaxID=1971748 RepID=UPI00307D17A4
MATKMGRVLHMHDSDLDDPRIINAAMTGKKAGYEPHFCGVRTADHMDSDVFASYHYISFSSKAKASRRLTGTALDSLWPWYPWPREAMLSEQRMRQVIDEVRPDLIHAHNIFAAWHCSRLGVPLVLDDHELFSFQVRISSTGGLKAAERERRWAEKERQLAARHPVITVSEPIAEHYRQFTSKVFCVPNYPAKGEVNPGMEMAPAAGGAAGGKKEGGGDLVSVYLGADSMHNPNPIRNIAGLHDIFDGKNTGRLIRIGVKSPNNGAVRSVGNIPMADAYGIMVRQGHIGLLPWQKHWFHRYVSPNKVGEYAHCGLLPLVISDAEFVVGELGAHCETFDDFGQLKERLAYYNRNRDELDRKRRAALAYAKSDLVWEKHESKILEAYKQAA